MINIKWLLNNRWTAKNFNGSFGIPKKVTVNIIAAIGAELDTVNKQCVRSILNNTLKKIIF